MSSIVRASASTSCVPCAGMEEEKSPCPSRAAELASACSGAPIRRASRSEANSASAASRIVTSTSRRTKLETAPATCSAGSRASMSRIASPVEAKSGRLAANCSRAGIGDDGDVAGRKRLRVHVAIGGFDSFQPVGDRQQVDLDADLLRKLGGEPVVELADRHDPPAGRGPEFRRARRAGRAAGWRP